MESAILQAQKYNARQAQTLIGTQAGGACFSYAVQDAASVLLENPSDIRC
jgi:hypothetical protein